MVVHSIAAISAKTLTGLLVKARAANWCHAWEWGGVGGDGSDATDIELANGIVADLITMTKRGPCTITADDLVSEATRNRKGLADPDAFSRSSLSEFLRFALGKLLEDINYQARPKSGGTIAARVLATIVSAAEEGQQVDPTAPWRRRARTGLRKVD